MVYITICCLIIIFLQCWHRRFLTATTYWVGYYYCFFVIAPLLLNAEDALALEYAQAGITSFLFAYLFGLFFIM
jgi:hypothetical protein